MNGKTAKLLRKVARTNPYNVKDVGEDETRYGKSKDGTRTVLAPGFRLTYKYLKKFYKQGRFTTVDLWAELYSANLRKLKEAELAESDVAAA